MNNSRKLCRQCTKRLPTNNQSKQAWRPSSTWPPHHPANKHFSSGSSGVPCTRGHHHAQCCQPYDTAPSAPSRPPPQLVLWHYPHNLLPHSCAATSGKPRGCRQERGVWGQVWAGVATMVMHTWCDLKDNGVDGPCNMQHSSAHHNKWQVACLSLHLSFALILLLISSHTHTHSHRLTWSDFKDDEEKDFNERGLCAEKLT